MFPAETAVAVVIPETMTGVEELVSVPVPSWPEPLYPQHVTLPSENRAQVWMFPAETAVAVVRPTKTGVGAFIVVPLPSWPEPLYPQHATVPSESRAQVW